MMQIDWANTPGSFYAIAYLASCCIIILNSPLKVSKRKTIAISGICGSILVVLMTLLKNVNIWLFVPNMLLFVMILWGIIFFTCDYDARTAVYFTTRAFITGEFIASLEWQFFYYLITYHVLPLNMFVVVTTMIVFDGLICLVIYWLEKKNREVNKQVRINNRELFSALSIALAIYATSNIIYIFNELTNISIVLNQLFIIRTLMDLGGMAILYAYHMQLGELNMRYEVERLQDMLEMQHNNYEMLEQSVNAVNQKYHDLKYQIAILKEEATAKESIEYLEQMEKEIKAYEAQNKTGNKILDTILTGKTLYCQNNWIELTSVVDGQAMDFMDPIDISTLFGNMLDNAIESVSKIDKKEKRLIHLAVTKQKGFLRIRMENCYENELQFENGLPTTTKKDHKYHGFGLKSIQNIVKKYQGSVTFNADNGWFETRILIPLNK